MKTLTLSVAISATIFLFSCQKESSNNEKPSAEISGTTWDLVSIDMEGQATSEFAAEGLGTMKSVMAYDYLTNSAEGVITFGADKMTSSNLAYVCSGTFQLQQFVDGTLMNSVDSTLDHYTMPASNGVVEFVKIGTDSLYCPNGGFIDLQGSGEMQSKPAGVKYSFDGDNLILKINEQTTETTNEDGMIQVDNTSQKATVLLKKK